MSEYELSETPEEQEDYDAVPIDTSQYPIGTNPSALEWWEEDPADFSGFYKRPTSDNSIVSGKNYYELPPQQMVSPEYMDIWQDQYDRQGGNSMPTAMAYSTYQTYLMYRTSTSGTYAKLIDIKDYPDMLGDVRLVLG